MIDCSIVCLSYGFRWSAHLIKSKYVKAGVTSGSAHMGIPIIDPLIGQDYNVTTNRHHHQRQLFTQLHQHARLLVNKNIFHWHHQQSHHHQWWWDSSTPPSSVDLEWEHEGYFFTSILFFFLFTMSSRCPRYIDISIYMCRWCIFGERYSHPFLMDCAMVRYSSSARGQITHCCFCLFVFFSTNKKIYVTEKEYRSHN